MEVEARIAGYAAHIRLPDGAYSDIDLQDAYAAWLKAEKLKPTAELWEAFEIGWYDAMDKPITVTEAAIRANVGRQYIKDEIWAGRLPAVKVGRQYEIAESDFAAWLNTPRRGSRSGTAEE